MFWPDGASSHYAEETLKVLEKFSIQYIKKDQNPPNVPQLRSIERFWAHLKQKVYQDNWCASDFKSLERRIKNKLLEFDSEYFTKLFTHEKEKIAKAAQYGPLSVIHFNK